MSADLAGFTLRPAEDHDGPLIRKLIHQVGINPLGLHWERFIVAANGQGVMIGCGQVKRHSDGSHELASIAVVQDWRSRGVASAIIRELMQNHQEMLYLTCRANLGSFYQQFGFREATQAELSPYFHRLSTIIRVLHFLRLAPGEGLLIMRSQK